MSAEFWSIVVSGTLPESERRELSNPTTLTSPGTVAVLGRGVQALNDLGVEGLVDAEGHPNES